MTISSTTRKAGPFVGNGTTTVFPFTFKVYDKTDIQVVFTNASGVDAALTLDSDYSVALNTDQANSPGGAITYPITGAALQANSRLTAIGALPNLQETDITNSGGFYPEVIEQMLDTATIQIQQLAEITSRSVYVSPSDPEGGIQLPPSGARASTVLGFDALGNYSALPITVSIGAGDLRDEVGSDGKPGFVAGTDFIAGTSTQITLSRAPGSIANVMIYFDGVYQGGDQIQSLLGAVLTFTAPIPSGTQRVYVRTGTTLSLYVPPNGSVGDAAPSVGSKFYNRLNDRVCVTDFGANQIIDAAAAFILAANYCHARGGGTVFIPAGTWQISTSVPSYPNVEFVGDGEFATILVATTPNMKLFTCVNSVITQTYNAFRNFTIKAAVSGVTGINLVLCRYAAIENITFLGCTNNFYIDRGYFFTLANLTSTSVDSALAAGSGVLTSTVDTDYVFHATISNYKLVSQGLGAPNTGLMMRRAIDTNVTDLHAYGVAPNCTVIVLENDCQAVKMKGLNIDGCAAGVLLQQGAGVAVLPSFTSIANSHIDQPTAFGIKVNGASRTTIKDVMFTPTGAHVDALPIYLISDMWTSIEGCQISGFSGNAAVQLSSSRLGRIVNNTIADCSIGVGFSGTPTGMTIDNSYDNVPNPIGGSPVGVGNRIKPNQYGFSPGPTFVTASPAMPATGVAFTNNTGFTCRVSVMGGTFTGISLNGTLIGIANNNWSGEVQPDETLAITYTVAPNWFWTAK